jgi:hypothetical protein
MSLIILFSYPSHFGPDDDLWRGVVGQANLIRKHVQITAALERRGAMPPANPNLRSD